MLLFGLMTSGFDAFLLGFNDLVCTVMTTVLVCFQDVLQHVNLVMETEFLVFLEFRIHFKLRLLEEQLLVGSFCDWPQFCFKEQKGQTCEVMKSP